LGLIQQCDDVDAAVTVVPLVEEVCRHAHA
jgi:hypothetical protein